MKEIKNFILFEIISILIKVAGGLLAHSYTLLSSAIFDVSLLIIMLVMTSKKENTKLKGIISSLMGLLFIILGIGITFLSIVKPFNKMSFWVILFVILAVIVRYLVNCIYTSTGYQKRKGILSVSLINSNTDFYNYGIILGALILFKFKKWLPILKYADVLGTILIAVLVIYKGFKIITKSFKYLEENEEIEEDKIKEIEERSEVKKVQNLKNTYYGGIRKTTCEIVLSNTLSMIDLNSFVVTLQDFLLKTAEIVRIDLVEEKKVVKKKPKVRSLKQDARNSRSGNSKTNTKKKNTKKKNKKR